MKSREGRAVSNVVTTIVLMTITVAAAALAYSIATGYVNTGRSNASLTVTSTMLSSGGGSDYFKISVLNSGTVAVPFSITLLGDGGSSLVISTGSQAVSSSEAVTVTVFGANGNSPSVVSSSPSGFNFVVQSGVLQITAGESYPVTIQSTSTRNGYSNTVNVVAD
ncbi:MAG: hypothetical protein JRN20_14830 [Nitrososphaerota archaeon]|nr:hypothetical protein [Nitrososphaerota archaeon]